MLIYKRTQKHTKHNMLASKTNYVPYIRRGRVFCLLPKRPTTTITTRDKTKTNKTNLRNDNAIESVVAASFASDFVWSSLTKK